MKQSATCSITAMLHSVRYLNTRAILNLVFLAENQFTNNIPEYAYITLLEDKLFYQGLKRTPSLNLCCLDSERKQRRGGKFNYRMSALICLTNLEILNFRKHSINTLYRSAFHSSIFRRFVRRAVHSVYVTPCHPQIHFHEPRKFSARRLE